MLNVGPQTSIFIAVKFVDFRLGIDGLAYRCRALLAQNPMSGSMFVFKKAMPSKYCVMTDRGSYYITSAGRREN